MKMLLIAAGLSLAALSACSTTQQDNLNASLANLNKTNLLALQAIKNGCSVVQPTLIAAGAASPQVAAAAAANGVVCATANVAADAAAQAVAAQAASAPAVPAATPAAATPATSAAPAK
jgi:hypothetical protein